MKFNIINKNSFVIYLNSSYIKDTEEISKESIKNIILLIKKRYSFKIFGFYEVNIYKIKNLINILVFKKIDNDELFFNSVDLKIINHKELIRIDFDDFKLTENINFNNINSFNVYKICEHYSINDLNLHQ